MKKSILLLASLALAAVTPALATDTVSETPFTVFAPASDVSVARGMSRETVTLMLGVPSETVGKNVWIYADFKGKGVPNAAKYDTLLLVFADDQVTMLRLGERDYKPSSARSFLVSLATTRS